MYKTVIPMGAPVNFITVSKVKTGQDALNLYSQVMAALSLTDAATLKRFELWQAAQSKGGLTIDNIVKMFQQMREYAQKAKANELDQKILSEAYWFYCNVEKPGICDTTPAAEIDEEVEDRFDITPFYFKPIFYVPTALLGVGLLYMILRK